MKKLTDLDVKNAKPKEKEYYIREGDGLVLRVRPTGSRSFYYIFDFMGKRCRYLLGSYPTLSLTNARKKHRQAVTDVGDGIDPRNPPAEKPPSIAGITLAELGESWFEEWSKVHHSPRVYQNYKYAWKSSILPKLGDRLVGDVKKKEILELLKEKAITAPGQAANIKKVLQGIYNFAVEDKEYLEVNPVSQIRVARVIPSMKYRARERVLSDSEIKSLWAFIDTGGGSEGTKKALKLILVTGQRPGEVSGMHTKEIEIGVGHARCQVCRGCGWWTIPAERTKSRKEHRVYLTSFALALIGTKNGYVCIGDDEKKALSANSIAYHVRRTVQNTGKIAFYGFERWTPHDLRRTTGTGLVAAGCREEVMDAILSHAVAGVTGVYNKYKYDKEKQFWLSQWTEKLQDTVHNVK